MSIKCISFSKDSKKKIKIKTSKKCQPTNINLSNQTPIRIKSIPENLICMEMIKEKDNENASSDKINSYISSVPKNRLLSISTNQKSINVQDINNDYLNNFNNARKIHQIKPFTDEINNIENDQLKNTSTEGIFESEFESESIKEIDPYISYDNSFLNKCKFLNIKNKNNFKNKKNPPSNIIKYYKDRGNLNNNNKKKCNSYKNYKHNKFNTIQSDKKPKKFLQYFNNNTLKCRYDYSANYKLDKKFLKKRLNENIMVKKISYYWTIDLSKIDNFKSAKKRILEKQKMLKIKKIKNHRNSDKKILNKNSIYNSEINFSKKHISNLGSGIDEKIIEKKNKEKKETLILRNKTEYDGEFSLLKGNFPKLNTHVYKFKNNLENYQRSGNKISITTKSNQPKKNDKICFISNIDLIKTKMNKYLMNRPPKTTKNKNNSNFCCKKKESFGYKYNPFVSDSSNSSIIGNEYNNNTRLSRVISIVDKKLSYMDKMNYFDNEKARNQKLSRK